MTESQNETSCCERERQRQIRLIQELYTSFPVIRDLPCPTCRRWISIRVYERGETGEAG
jgi:hypothetical protein